MPDRRMWLIGGTSESRQLAEALALLKLPCTVTVTTESARSLYPSVPTLRVLVGRLHPEQVGQFLQQEQIVAILDASHPYARDISQVAIGAAGSRQISYLRYERAAIDLTFEDAKVIYLDSFDTLISGDYLHGKRVMLTVGYKPLALLGQCSNRSTLFARILPSIASIDAAIAAGIKPERIIAIRPPVNAELERVLWRQWEISLVVTKASGAAGGEDIKRTVAAELGIPLIVITRPNIDYPQQTSDFSVVLEFCRQHFF